MALEGSFGFVHRAWACVPSAVRHIRTLLVHPCCMSRLQDLRRGRYALLLVLAGRPGTGKTTLGKQLTVELGAAYLRADAMVMPLMRSRLTEDPAEAARAAYEVAHEVAAENLQVGRSVVFDGLNATHLQRAAWGPVAMREGADLLVAETTLSDSEEHQRRVNERQGEPEGYLGPSWDSIQTCPYDPWDEARYGPRLVVDMSDARAGLSVVMSRVRELRNRLDVAAQMEG